MPYARTPLQRLPRLQLNGPAGTIRLHAPELGAPVLLLVRNEALDRSRPYISALVESLSELRNRDGRALLITEDDVGKTGLPSAVASRDVWDSLSIDDSALIIADRWGVVYVVKETTTFEDLPPAEEVVGWVRYLAMQRPECGVIDEPGYGEWAL
ncbi:MAG: hypothetical protein ACRELT_16420 [Longimicrobiales bacterium]